MPLLNPVWFPFAGQMPAQAGVYLIVDRDNNPVYIGETDDFDRRMKEHRSDRLHAMHRYAPAGVWFEVQAVADVRAQRAAALIAEYAPPANG
jgi:predicted GIY-YIG superfamily endonuclease